jgi:ribosome-associated protein
VTDAGGPLLVDADLSIPRHELTFRATRAGGPGGQHVNTSSTRVEVVWNVAASGAVSADQRDRLIQKLASRLDSRGNLRVVGSAHRSQTRNREDAEARLSALVRNALIVPKARKKTRPTRAAKEKRLRTKRHLSDKKRHRRSDHDDS